jgi:hypothetical protein
MTEARAEARVRREISDRPAPEADVVVGLLSEDDAQNISLPAVKASEGLCQAYPDLKGLIVASDCSPDEAAQETFLNTPTVAPKLYISTPPDGAGRLQAMFNVMHVAKRVNAKVTLLIDASLTSVKRTWIARLADPIVNGQSALTAPFYHSAKFDFPVNSLLAYPMFRALFGRRIRKPFNADRAFSGELNEAFLAYDRWPVDAPCQAAEMTMCLLASARGATICQSFMAAPRFGRVRPPLGVAAGLLFQDVARSLFDLTASRPDLWLQVVRSRPTAVTGTDIKPNAAPPREISPLEFFWRRIIELVDAHSAFWSETFQGRADHVYAQLKATPPPKLTMPAETWTRQIYQSALVWPALNDDGRRRLLEALTPLFYARLLGWFKAGANLTGPQLEALTEDDARLFESLKGEFVAAWRAAGRTGG